MVDVVGTVDLGQKVRSRFFATNENRDGVSDKSAEAIKATKRTASSRSDLVHGALTERMLARSCQGGGSEGAGEGMPFCSQICGDGPGQH